MDTENRGKENLQKLSDALKNAREKHAEMIENKEILGSRGQDAKSNK